MFFLSMMPHKASMTHGILYNMSNMLKYNLKISTLSFIMFAQYWRRPHIYIHTHIYTHIHTQTHTCIRSPHLFPPLCHRDAHIVDDVKSSALDLKVNVTFLN